MATANNHYNAAPLRTWSSEAPKQHHYQYVESSTAPKQQHYYQYVNNTEGGLGIQLQRDDSDLYQAMPLDHLAQLDQESAVDHPAAKTDDDAAWLQMEVRNRKQRWKWLVAACTIIACTVVVAVFVSRSQSPSSTNAADSSSKTDCINAYFDGVTDQCESWTLCKAGEYVSQAGTATSDQLCSACPNGTYQAQSPHLALACQPWQSCRAGQYVSASGTAASDRACTLCPNGTYQNNSDHTASQCLAWNLCPQGMYFHLDGTRFDDRICIDCPPESFQNVTNHTQAACKPMRLCRAGEHMAVAGTRSSDRECQACPAETYQNEVLYTTTRCIQSTLCQAGQYAVFNGTVSSDRLCAPCPAGQYQSAINHSFSTCLSWTSCTDTFELKIGSATSNRVCAQRTQTLGRMLGMTVNGTYLNVCMPGFHVDAQQPSSCLPCRNGQYQPNVTDATGCEPCQTACDPGKPVIMLSDNVSRIHGWQQH
eukprot:TRINITY_DN12524_c0_g4_i13.p1 TRINITY_DN12524_c0_g4~~TRINITY_DN12524_c0_g4_i13.p1  ORF type:complete len:480 (+),score=42.51 TRINITY_DN12524_c0_g4_i13:108-1547(+)